MKISNRLNGFTDIDVKNSTSVPRNMIKNNTIRKVTN